MLQLDLHRNGSAITILLRRDLFGELTYTEHPSRTKSFIMEFYYGSREEEKVYSVKLGKD